MAALGPSSNLKSDELHLPFFHNSIGLPLNYKPYSAPWLSSMPSLLTLLLIHSGESEGLTDWLGQETGAGNVETILLIDLGSSKNILVGR